MVWKLDRLGRNLRHLINTVHDLTIGGIGLRVLTGQGAAIDTTTAAGKLVFGIFAALAEFERELITERTLCEGGWTRTWTKFCAVGINAGNYGQLCRTIGGARSPRKRVCAGKFPANRENNRDNLKIGPFLSKIKTERFELSDGWAINSLRVRAGNKCAVTGN